MEVRFDFSQKNFIVTGASSGIGRNVVMELAEANANVLAIARREDKLASLKNCFPKNIAIAPLDICNEYLLEAAIKKFVLDYGKIDGSIHAAGLVEFTPMRAFNFDKAKIMMEVNFWSGIRLLEIATKMKYANKNSSHVQISSVNAHKGQRGLSAYCAVKAAMCAGIRTFSKELGKKNIRVNTVSPGIVDTPLTDQLAIESLLEEYPLGQGETTDISGVIMFLLSDRARWITGTDIVVDGGYLA